MSVAAMLDARQKAAVPNGAPTVGAWPRLASVCLAAVLMGAVLAFGAVGSTAIFALQVASALLLVLWGVHAAISGGATIARNVLYAPVLVFAVLIAGQLAFGFTSYRHDTLTEALLFGAYGLFFFVAVQVFADDSAVSTFAGILIAFGGLLATYSIIQGFVGPKDTIYWVVKLRYTPGNAYGPYVSHSHYAGLMEMLIPFPAAFAIWGRVAGERRLLFGFVAVLMTTSVFLSGSRAGMACVIVELAFVAALAVWSRRTRRSVIAAAAALVVVAAFVVELGGDSVLRRMGDASDPYRISIATDTIHMIAKHPVLGYGFGTFSTVFPRYRTFFTDLFVNRAHNDYLELTADTGLVGLAIAIWFIVALYWRGTTKVRLDAFSHRRLVTLAALAGCTGLLLHGFVDFNLHIPANAAFFFTLCAIVTSENGAPSAGSRRPEL